MEIDENEETATVTKGAKAGDRIRRLWRKWHQIDYRLFLEWIWKLQWLHTVQDAIAVTGTANLALRLLQVLAGAGCLTVAADGQITWTKRVFPAPGTFRHPDLADPDRPPLPDFQNNHQLGQFRATWSSSLRRAQRLFQDLPPGHTRVFFCGDDDLTSIALANLADFDIVVGDVDPRVINGINGLARQYGLQVRAIHCDVREPVPAELRRQYHVFHCDPLDSGAGLDLWLARAMEVLTGEIGDRIYLNVSMRRLGGRLCGLEDFLAAQGFALVAIEPCHSAYPVSGEDDRQSGPLAGRAAQLGLAAETVSNLCIHTDLMVFRRVRPRPELWPQDFLDLRRLL